MLTKAKVIVLAILLIMVVFLTLFLMQERRKWDRMTEERITMTYGILLMGIDSQEGPSASFNVNLGLAIAERLNMRPTFIAIRPDLVTWGFDDLQYDVFIPSMPVPADMQSSYALSKPFLYKPSEPGLYAIVLRKESERLASALNNTLELMFADGSMRRISVENFGADLVTPAWQSW